MGLPPFRSNSLFQTCYQLVVTEGYLSRFGVLCGLSSKINSTFLRKFTHIGLFGVRRLWVRAFLATQTVNNQPAMQETCVRKMP